MTEHLTGRALESELGRRIDEGMNIIRDASIETAHVYDVYYLIDRLYRSDYQCVTNTLRCWGKWPKVLNARAIIAHRAMYTIAHMSRPHELLIGMNQLCGTDMPLTIAETRVSSITAVTPLLPPLAHIVAKYVTH